MGDRPKKWYPRYPADFIADTADLTLEEKGAYSALLDHHFLNDSIPADMHRISLILSVSTQKTRKLWQVLSRFFHQKGDRFYQKRMEREIAKAIDISEKRSAASQKRWNANADAIGDAIGNTATATTTLKNKNNTSNASRFDEWYAVYPKKVGKKEAAKIWKSRKLDAVGAVIIRGREYQTMADALISDVRERIARDGKWLDGFIPNPTTYLRGDRWEDALEPVRAKSSGLPNPNDPDAVMRWAQTHGKPEPRPGENGRQYLARVAAA